MVLASSQSVGAQLCVADSATIDSFEGKIVLVNQTALRNIKIRLRTNSVKEQVVQETTSDAEGNFRFADIRAGKYRVVVEEIDGLKNLTANIRLRRTDTKSPRIGLKIVMALVFTENCSNIERLFLEQKGDGGRHCGSSNSDSSRQRMRAAITQKRL